MDILPFLPGASGLCSTGMQLDRGTVALELASVTSTALCPTCGQPARRVHSRYNHQLADLPLMGTPARLHVRVRRFFCDTPTCPRTTFVEPLHIVEANGESSRLRDSQQRIQRRRITTDSGGEASATAPASS